ncbi:hypothetical protein GOODEAATRI_031265 [Goodea atripinnis]|uniref:Uncharacterized protein n=1 Tax=Goodea atripinnis TaxID=208336 RepID=A0ABV0PTK2_9TELE
MCQSTGQVHLITLRRHTSRGTQTRGFRPSGQDTSRPSPGGWAEASTAPRHLKVPEPAPRVSRSLSLLPTSCLLPAAKGVQVNPPCAPALEVSDKAVQIDTFCPPVSEISNEGVQVDLPCAPVPELLRGPQPSEFPCEFKFPEPLGQPPGKVLCGFLLLLASKFPALLLLAPRTV